MPAIRSAAQQAASRVNGARSQGPATAEGKARSARNGTRHGLRGSPFVLLPGEDQETFTALRAAVSSDWGPRDAYEQHWVMELVASMWRQNRLRGLELATLAAAESPPAEATVRKLGTYARYGTRIDRDIGRALQALRVLRKRADAWIEDGRECTSEPGGADAPRNFTNELPPRTTEPERAVSYRPVCTNEPAPRTSEPGPATAAPPPVDPTPHLAAKAGCTSEPTPGLNRRQRRALAARLRRRAA